MIVLILIASILMASISVIQFKNEAVLDQELFIYNEDISDHHYRHLITDKTTGKDILMAESVWK